MSTPRIQDLKVKKPSNTEILLDLIEKGEIDFSNHIWNREEIDQLRETLKNECNKQNAAIHADAAVQAMAGHPQFKWRPKGTEYYEYNNGMIRRDGLYRRLLLGEDSVSARLYRQTWIETCMFIGSAEIRNNSKHWNKLKSAGTPEKFREAFLEVYNEELPLLHKTIEQGMNALLQEAYSEGARKLEDIYVIMGRQMAYEHEWAYSTVCLMQDVQNLSSLVNPIHLFVNRRSDNIAGRYLRIYGENFGDTITSVIDNIDKDAKKDGSNVLFDYYDMSSKGDVIDAVLAALCWPKKLVLHRLEEGDNLSAVRKLSVVFENSSPSVVNGCWELKADLAYNIDHTVYLCASEMIGSFRSNKEFLAWASSRLLPAYPVFLMAMSAIINASSLIEKAMENQTRRPTFQRFQVFGAEAQEWIASCKALLDKVQSKEEVYSALENMYRETNDIGKNIMEFFKVLFNEIKLDPITMYNNALEWLNNAKPTAGQMNDIEEQDFIFYRSIHDIASAFINPEE